ncbi:MAG: hypothetical protein JRN62_04095 [Nitrososphaerota archaeon]|nr:hypothetical protein [Nitrososphaerota archaeon]
MNGLTISLDIDDTLAATMERVLCVLSKRTGKQFDLEQITAWDLTKFFPLNQRQVQRLFGSAWSKGNWIHIHAMERGMKARIDELNKIGSVTIVTSAGVDQVPGKMKWLEHHGIELPLTVVPFGWTKEMLGHSVYIDDRPETIERAVALGKIGLLYDRPWNRGCDAGIRIHSLGEAVEIVKNVQIENRVVIRVRNRLMRPAF